jgi:flagellar hook-basal body complex protein FliE
METVVVNPISPDALNSVGPVRPGGTGPTPARGAGEDFAAQLRAQLEQVSAMQAEADQGVERLLTGQSDNLTEVFTTARKAEVAFTLLMEIRNKLVDAYSELRQMRV